MLFFESGDTEVFKADRSKLFASNKRQIDNHTLMLDMLHSYMSVVCTYHCRGVFKKVFFYTRQPPGWKSRRPQNDVYLAFVLNAIIFHHLFPQLFYKRNVKCKLTYLVGFASGLPAGNHSASHSGFLLLSPVLPTSHVFTSGYVNTETILHFFIITFDSGNYLNM